ncbi:MAG TPA: ATP-grasp domain-containing protein [Oscillospiraceae bacterium]|nr:ATP-grasp domain-containing protein [Oscillospiraceae bacterium]
MSDFLPLLFGGDINVYSMARAFHEAYGLRSTVYGKFPTGPCCDSRIIDLHTFGMANEQQDTFFRNVCDFAAAHRDTKVLLIGCGDSYVKLAAENRDRFPENVVAPYVGGDLIDTLINKENFYNLCDLYGIDRPATFVYRREMGHDFKLPFDPPFIAKPADGVLYWEHPFPTQKKVFKAKSRAELEAILDDIYAAGYPGSMIIQDFIPGDDSYMRVLTSYSDGDGKVRLMCLGHVLLEEHTPHGIGNHAVILTERDEALCGKLKAFLEAISFTGFSNFDIKYDRRDNTFRVFEINVRQGRSNYYVTATGYNLARIVTEDRIYGRREPFAIADEKILWHMVPFGVAEQYIDAKYHGEMRALRKAGKAYDPLRYGYDNGLRLRLRYLKNQYAHYGKYKKYMEKTT